MKSVVIAIEGFNLKQGYVIKELSIVYSDNTYQHYQFKTPETFVPTAADIKTINYTNQYLNGFSIEDNYYLPNILHSTILNEFKNFKIYVVGQITRRFISNILLETAIIDVCSLMDFQFPDELPDPHCFKPHRYRYCSLAKARFIKTKLDVFYFKEDVVLY